MRRSLITMITYMTLCPSCVLDATLLDEPAGTGEGPQADVGPGTDLGDVRTEDDMSSPGLTPIEDMHQAQSSPVGIEALPARLELAPGERAEVMLRASYPQGGPMPRVVMTTESRASSSDPDVVSVDGSDASRWRVTGVRAGEARITMEFGEFSLDVPVTIAAPAGASCTDEFEGSDGNDSCSDPTRLEPADFVLRVDPVTSAPSMLFERSSPLHDSLALCLDDDVYCFDVTAGDTVEAVLRHEDAAAGIVQTSLRGPADCERVIAFGMRTRDPATSTTLETIVHAATTTGEYCLVHKIEQGLEVPHDLSVLITR